MRFPSIDALARQARSVLTRFPWVLAAGLVAAVAANAGVKARGPDEDYWARVVLATLLGLPLFTAMTLLAEQVGWGGLKKTILLAAGALAIIGFYQVWPGAQHDYNVIRYLQLSAALHLLVAFLPFLGRMQRDAFWQYNRLLFEAFLRAVLFSGVLFLGFSIALVSLDQLFGVHIAAETYLRLWFVMAFVVNTWIFLSGVPHDLQSLAAVDDYPRPLKVFAQYILTPLVTIYLVLLLAYLVKILITGDWPSGWVGYLVASVAVVGLLGYLLVTPLRDREGEGWIRTYSRALFLGLVPAAVMFLLALWKRIEPYGLTELRVLGFLLGLWLLGIALYYSVKRNADIHLIPITLAAILLVTLYGPLSATSLSIRSQAGRIRELLGQGTTDAAIPTSAQGEISSALRFLLEHDARDAIQGSFGTRAGNLASLPEVTVNNRDSLARAIMDSAGLQYDPTYNVAPAGYFSFNPNRQSFALRITGYDYAFSFSDSTTVLVQGDSLMVKLDSASHLLRVTRRGESLLDFDLLTLADSLITGEGRVLVPPGELSMATEGNEAKGMIRLTWMNGRRTSAGLKVNGLSGELYLKLPAGPDSLSVPGTP
jgi:hypothetical protein